MPKPTRVICRTCGTQLGSLLNNQLVVWGHEVRYDPRGIVTITCTSCKTERR
jgi:hypothetical protein